MENLTEEGNEFTSRTRDKGLKPQHFLWTNLGMSEPAWDSSFCQEFHGRTQFTSPRYSGVWPQLQAIRACIITRVRRRSSRAMEEKEGPGNRGLKVK